jgi:hypothetical protein
MAAGSGVGRPLRVARGHVRPSPFGSRPARWSDAHARSQRVLAEPVRCLRLAVESGMALISDTALFK